MNVEVLQRATTFLWTAMQVADPAKADRDATAPEMELLAAEVVELYERVKGNRKPGTAYTSADARLMMESSMRRAVEIMDEAKKGQVTP